MWENNLEVCFNWASEALKTIKDQKVNDEFQLSIAWIYQNVHLKGAGNHYQRGRWDNDALINMLLDLFAKEVKNDRWKHINDLTFLSPEGVEVEFSQESRYLANKEIFTPQVHLYGMPGWHLVTSIHGFPQGKRIRFYLPTFANLQSLPKLALLLQNLTCKWHLKIRTDICDLRPDRLVLYIDESSANTMKEQLYSLAEKLETPKESLPVFSWNYFEKIGYAPDLISGTESFGQYISRVVFKYVEGLSNVDKSNAEKKDLDELSILLLQAIQSILR